MTYNWKLTEELVKNAEIREKAYKLYDGHGLFLLVHPNGGKYWRYKYHVKGKEKVLALGTMTDLSLEDARWSLREYRKLRLDGFDPMVLRAKAKNLEVDERVNDLEKIVVDSEEKIRRFLRNLKKLIHAFENDIEVKVRVKNEKNGT